MTLSRDSAGLGCPYHPEVPADSSCQRCGRRYCADCLRDSGGVSLGPCCRGARLRRRLVVGAIVALMFAAPAAAILWGFQQRLRYGRHRHRIRARQKLLERFPTAAGVRLRLAQDLLRAGRRQQARDELDRLLKTRPSHIGGLLLRARMATQDRDHEAALRYASRALLAAPRSRAARLAVARAHLALGRPDRAERSLAEGLRTDPGGADISLELAALLRRMGRLTEARRVLSRAASAARSRWDRRRIRIAMDALPSAPRPASPGNPR